ncbi:IspD/TarI family cytidylyltransferase [Mycolicibacterium thermoresistibile]
MTFAAIVPLPAQVHRPDVFMPLAGVPALVRVVRMLAEETTHGTVVVAAAELADEVGALLTAVPAVEVVVATGAGRRVDCLRTGLAALRNQPRPPQYVLIHDHRRPLTPRPVAERVRGALAAGSAAVIPALSFTDSAKTVDAAGSITATLDRAVLRTAQYPRGFAVACLEQLLADAGPDADEVAETRRADIAVTLVDGDPDGFAVQLPDAGRFVEAVIAARSTPR